jgi:hypothetical protein
MPNVLEYTLSLNDKISGKLKQIGIANDEQLSKWAKVQQQVAGADNTMQKCGVSIGSLRERVAALRAERDWIPASNIKAIRRTNIEAKALDKQIRHLETINGGRLKSWFSNLKSAIPILKAVCNPLLYMVGAIYKVERYIKDATDAWQIQMQAETKLTTIMRQRMNASDEEIDSIKRLTSAQQKIGVIGDEVQLAGAQQIATFVKKKSSIEALIPAMNNLLAQQKGLKATDQDAVNIGNLMGKVLQGQTSALTRVGITFTQAEEKVLKYGNEQERAAMLAKVINNNVGLMNEAIAATPDGKMKQHANAMGDVQERVGRLYTNIKVALLPLFETMGNGLERITAWFERNEGLITGIVQTIGNIIGGVLSFVGRIVSGVARAFSWWFDKLREGNIPVVAITGALLVLATTIKLITKAKQIWAITQNILNMSLWACPITWIVAAIIALIAVIAYVAYTTEGWGETWSNTWEWIKTSFAQAGAWLKLQWLKTQDAFLTGFDLIKVGWYKLKSLWDKDGAEQGLAAIRNERNARAEEIARAQGKIDELAAKRKAIDIWQVRSNGKSLSDVTGELKRKLGIEEPSVPGMTPAFGTGGDSESFGDGGSGYSGGGVRDASGISTGGNRSSSITINLGSLVGTMTFAGGYEGERDNMLKDMESAFVRLLAMAGSTR